MLKQTFDSGLATKTTDNLTEGTTNLYYTQSRAQTDFDSGLATKTTDDVTEGTTNLYYTQSTGTKHDFDSGFATKTTSDLAEGTNLYYTNARFDSDLDSAINAGKISLWDSAKTVAIVDSYVDSDFVGQHQRFMYIQTATPTAPLRSGEMWLDPDVG